MKRDVDYRWRLAELMAAHGMHNGTDLMPRLAERGINLSRPQVYRIVASTTRTHLAAADGRTMRHPRLRRGGPRHRHRHRRPQEEPPPAPLQPPNVIELDSRRSRRARVITDDTD